MLWFQVLESEKKNRLQNVLGLKLVRYGWIKFSVENIEDEMVLVDLNTTSEDELSQYVDFSDNTFGNSGIDEDSLIYVSGHTAFKMKHHLKCSACITKLTSLDDIDNEYFLELDRGGLSSNLLMIVGILWLCICDAAVDYWKIRVYIYP